MEAILMDHFRYNFIPPIDSVNVGAALEAIEAAESDEWDREIELWNGVRLSASRIIEELHLGGYIRDLESGEWEPEEWEA